MSNRALFGASVLALFLELMLIRWIGSEVREFAFVQNTVLVACLMGLGLGCLGDRRPFAVGELNWPWIELVLVLATPWARSALGWAITASPDRAWASLIAAVGLTWLLLSWTRDALIPIGRLIGRLIDDDPRPIRAYSLNVAGGLLGTWLFVLLSALELPPIVWTATAAVLVVALVMAGAGGLRWVDGFTLIALVGVSALATHEPGALKILWSPYEKLTVRPSDPRAGEVGKYTLAVNNAANQALIDLSARHVHADPSRFPPAMRGLSQYDIPYLLHPRPRSVLIVGAGAGNDAAGALRHVNGRIRAVEIDPGILELGRRYHPERPYDSPRVELAVDDARSYFTRCRDRFDVIAFGLLDAQTTPPLTNALLDHYVYTVESIRRVRSLLADGGIVVLACASTDRAVDVRMAGLLRVAFGAEPITFGLPRTGYGYGGLLLVAGDLAAVRRQIAAQPRLASLIARGRVVLSDLDEVPLTTDDWPYIYLRRPSIPALYLALSGLLILLFIRGLTRQGARGILHGWGRSSWHFAFLGAAFLLVEIEGLSTAAVALGSTWRVNAVVISGVLAAILLANALATRSRWPSWIGFAGVGVTCPALYGIEPAWFGSLSDPLKAALVGGLTALPLFFSGLIFARSLARAERKDRALGANLLGALVGGLLQALTFVTGIRALLLVATGLYLAAWLTRPRDPFIGDGRPPHQEPKGV